MLQTAEMEIPRWISHLVRARRLQLEEHRQEAVADDRRAQQVRHVYHDELRAVRVILGGHTEQRDGRHEGHHQGNRDRHDVH